MKKCFKCGKLKLLDDFYKHPKMADGHLGKCKECACNDVSANYRKNINHYVAYEQKRSGKPHRKQLSLNQHKVIKNRKPTVYFAWNAVSNAIRSGKLKKKPCEVCGSLDVQAHHDDYSKPLDVRWLCFKHHCSLHGRIAH